MYLEQEPHGSLPVHNTVKLLCSRYLSPGYLNTLSPSSLMQNCMYSRMSPVSVSSASYRIIFSAQIHLSLLWLCPTSTSWHHHGPSRDGGSRNLSLLSRCLEASTYRKRTPIKWVSVISQRGRETEKMVFSLAISHPEAWTFR